MKKTSAKRILCSRYTFAGEASGRLPAMHVVTSAGGSGLCRQNFAEVGGRTVIFSGMEKGDWRSQNPEAKFIASTSRMSPRSSCNICKSRPSVSGRVPALTKINPGQAEEWKTETPLASMVFCVGSGFYFVQTLNPPLEKSCQAAAMTGLEFKVSGCRIAGGRSGKLSETIHRLGFTQPEAKIVRDRHKAPSETP
jgi:hypothetical protein